jgi:hypothetical protein
VSAPATPQCLRILSIIDLLAPATWEEPPFLNTRVSGGAGAVNCSIKSCHGGAAKCGESLTGHLTSADLSTFPMVCMRMGIA